MKPELVVIKAFGGMALVRLMIGVLPTVAKITDDAGASEIASGRDPQFVVGFPLQDVFELPDARSIADGDSPNWSEFRPKFG
jgi:hypothetical protein